MRRNTIVARRYSKTLFQLAESENKTAVVAKELEAFLSVLQSNPEIQRFFLNPIIDKDSKKEVLDSLDEKLPETEKFLKVVIEADRLEFFEEMVFEFKSLVEKSSGEISVALEVARKPSEKQLKEISQIVEGQFQRKPKFLVKENKKLLGGFIARTNSRTLDASVYSQLKRLESDLEKSA